MDKAQLEQGLEALKQAHGEWTYDIPLPYGVWTRGNLQIPHTRLRRIVQIVSDWGRKPLAQCRVLDLGCLDGMFSIEFAQRGAQTIGVEIREDNIRKAIFCKEALGLDNLEFRRDDVRNIAIETYGKFDVIICSGLLYHLPALDAIRLVQTMFAMTDGLVVVDTHVALEPRKMIHHEGHEYWGTLFREHSEKATPEQKAKSLWASADNSTSFWFTRPSLVNLLSGAGFSSVHECLTPAHLNYGQPGLEHRNRCTLVALKGELCDLLTSPVVRGLREEFPERSLTYAPESTAMDLLKALGKKMLGGGRRKG